MAKTILAGLLFFQVIFRGSGFAQSNFDRQVFYHVLAVDSLNLVNAELEKLKKGTFPDQGAFEGTLLMKKAGLVGFPKDKLSNFKAGHTRLEAAIAKDSGNAEFRFLRLVIQEHAPGIVNYRKNLEEDGKFVRDSFKDLPKVVQQAILDYSKKSKTLHPQDF